MRFEITDKDYKDLLADEASSNKAYAWYKGIGDYTKEIFSTVALGYNFIELVAEKYLSGEPIDELVANKEINELELKLDECMKKIDIAMIKHNPFFERRIKNLGLFAKVQITEKLMEFKISYDVKSNIVSTHYDN